MLTHIMSYFQCDSRSQTNSEKSKKLRNIIAKEAECTSSNLTKGLHKIRFVFFGSWQTPRTGNASSVHPPLPITDKTNRGIVTMWQVV